MFISFLVTDETEKKWPFLADCPVNSALRHWRQFDCVLMFSPTYYCINLMAAKTYICDLIFLQQFSSTQSDMHTNTHRTEECF